MKTKLDLIIPAYKDKRGLYQTLFSIGLDAPVQVTIVDDCSGDSYEDVLNCFNQFFPIRVLTTPQNIGPGGARQFGFDHTFNDYVIFIDCGDVFFSPSTVNLMLASIEEGFSMVSFGHYEEKFDGSLELFYPGHNRMHGKIYKRAFLKKYNIRFNVAHGRCNEDIGFNMNCRLIGKHLEAISDVDYIGHNEFGAVIWKNNAESITRRNECAFYYKEQNMGLAANAYHAICNAEKNKVDEEIISELKYDVFCSLYFFYISTLHRKPEFAEEAFEGAYYFYHNCFGKIVELDLGMLSRFYYDIFVSLVSDPEDPIRDSIITVNLYDFILMLQEREKGELNNE